MNTSTGHLLANIGDELGYYLYTSRSVSDDLLVVRFSRRFLDSFHADVGNRTKQKAACRSGLSPNSLRLSAVQTS